MSTILSEGAPQSENDALQTTSEEAHIDDVSSQLSSTKSQLPALVSQPSTASPADEEVSTTETGPLAAPLQALISTDINNPALDRSGLETKDDALDHKTSSTSTLAEGVADGSEQPMTVVATGPRDEGEQQVAEGDVLKASPIETAAAVTHPPVSQNQATAHTGDPSQSIATASLTGTTAAPTPVTTGPAVQSSPLAPVAQKKFTSLNVNKIFLEKASPTPAHNVAASSPTIPKATTNGGFSQSTASRLTSAKLSAAGKPSQPSWASTAPVSATSPGPAVSPVPSFGQAAVASGVSPGVSGTVTTAGMTPRLGTSLNTTSTNRSASPRLTLTGTESSNASVPNRGSPGLRNATLGSLNRSGSPATSTGSGGGGSMLAPWANLKANSASLSSSKSVGVGGRSPYANPDFPTAAEAAAVKKAQEEKEKAEAAEAAARHEQHLRNLDRFRGQALGSGKHWDEMEDEDGGFLDEVLEFADGTQYKVQPTTKESEIASTDDLASSQQTGPPVTKEERFRDVDHDRSWPLRGASAASQQQGATPAAQTQPPLPKRATVRETLDITSGAASLSLDALHAYDSRSGSSGSRMDRGWGSRGSRTDRDGDGPYGSGLRRESKGASDLQQQAQSAVRAWGPLAVRQQSLNPEAARAQAATAQPQPSHTSATPSVTAQPRSPILQQSAKSPVISYRSPPTVRREVQPLDQQAPASVATPYSAMSHSGRAPPPHLALRQQEAQSERHDSPTISLQNSSVTAEAQRSPSARLHDPASQQQPRPTAFQIVEPTSSHTAQQSLRSPTFNYAASTPAEGGGEDQATEMLSAAERARRRRQEEEERRAAEKERARQKALAIEERMKKEAEQKAAEAEQRRKELEEQQQRHRAALQEEEDRRKAEAERTRRLEAEQAAAVVRRADNLWRPRDHSSTQVVTEPATGNAIANLAQAPNGRTPYVQPQHQAQTSPTLSPSEEASSWRRRAPAMPVSSQQDVRSAHREPPSSTPALASPQRMLLKRPPVVAPTSAEGMANLDDVMGRIRGAMQQQHNTQDTYGHAAAQATGASGKTDSQGASLSTLTPTLDKTPVSTTPSILRAPQVLVNQERAAAAAAKALQEQQTTTTSKATPATGVRTLPLGRVAHPNEQASKPAALPRVVKPEPFVTKPEPPMEQPPVWNKFKVSLKGSSGHIAKKNTFLLSNAQNKFEKARRGLFNQTEIVAPAVLTWEPMIPGLSIRTLSRDDQFFPKKYRKGTVITNVVLPSKRLLHGGPAPLSLPPRRDAALAGAPKPEGPAAPVRTAVAVKLPASAKAAPAANGTAVVPTIAPNASSIPTEPASMRARNLASGSFPVVSSVGPNEAASVQKTSHTTLQSPVLHGAGTFDQLMSSTRPELDFGAPALSPASAHKSTSQHRRGSGNDGVAFAQGIGSGWSASGLSAGQEIRGGGSTGSVSPVSFMVHSELDPSGARQSRQAAATVPEFSGPLAPSSSSTPTGHTSRGVADSFLGSTGAHSLHSVPLTTSSSAFPSTKPAASRLSSSSTPHSTTHTPLLPPASGLGSATWGQGPLTFLEATPNSRLSSLHANTPGDDQGRIKEMWARSDGFTEYGYGPTSASSGLTTGLGVGRAATHNSLRDIADDFLPSTLRMTLNDFSDTAMPTSAGGGGSVSAPSTSPNSMRSPAHSRFASSASQQQPQRGLPPHMQQPQQSRQQTTASYGPNSYVDSSSTSTSAGYSTRSRAVPSQSAFQYGSHQPLSQAAVFSSSLGPVETAATHGSVVASSGFDPTVEAFTSSATKTTPYGSWAAPSATSAIGASAISGGYESYGSGTSPFSSRSGAGAPYRSYQPQNTVSSNSPTSFSASMRSSSVGHSGGPSQSPATSHQTSPFSNRGPASHHSFSQHRPHHQQQGEDDASATHSSSYGGGAARLGGYGSRGGGGGGGAGGHPGGSSQHHGAVNVDSTAALW